MYHIGICDDGKEICSELENILYEFCEKLRMEIEVSVWYTGEILCDYLKQNQIFEYYSKGIFLKLPYKEIKYFYSQNKKINMIAKNQTMQFNGKLKEIASSAPHNFIMIHQSYLVNLDYMQECSYELMKMQGGILLNISQPYRKSARKQVMQYKWGKK